MNIFEQLQHIFCATNTKWILNLDDKDVSPVIIQRYMVMNNATINVARIMNKFVYTLPPKMYLSALWTLITFNGKKYNRAPFIKYIKKDDKNDLYSGIYAKLKRQYKMSDKDFEHVKPFVKKSIDNNKVAWFSYYGMHNSAWVNAGIDFRLITSYGNRSKVEPKVKGLAQWT